MGSNESFERYTHSLPAPLSNEEQEKLLRIYCVTKDDEIRELLIVHNLKLVEHIVRKYVAYGSLDDFMQIATIEFMRALDNYDISKGVKFSTYAYECIKGRLYATIFDNRRKIDALDWVVSSIKNFIISDENEEIEEDVIEAIVDDDSWIDDYVALDKLNSYLMTLGDRDRFFLEHTLGVNGKEKLSQREMAKLYNISLSRVNAKVDELMRRLQVYYASDFCDVEFEITDDMIKRYINQTLNQTEICMLEHYYGINGKEKMTKTQLARMFRTKYNTLDTNLRRTIARVREMVIIENFTHQEKIGKKEMAEYVQGDISDLEKYCIEHFYGINGQERMNYRLMAKECGVSHNVVTKILTDARKFVQNKKDEEMSK